MAPRLYLGLNLNFAKYVFGRRHTIDLALDQLGIRHLEMVADNDYGPVFYTRSPDAFKDYHHRVAEHAAARKVKLVSSFTVYRDAGAITHSNSEIRESAYLSGLSIIEQAACYGAEFAGLSLFTMNREDSEDPALYDKLFDEGMTIWKRWMEDAARLGVPRLVVEMAAAHREGCSSISETRRTLDILNSHHAENPTSTSPVCLCYDTGHGISQAESPDDKDRDYKAWIEAFPAETYELHLKQTDPEFLATGHFEQGTGFIDPAEVLRTVRDRITAPEVYMFLEIPGKRGRTLGEDRNIEEHKASIAVVENALAEVGYRKNEDDGGWDLQENEPASPGD
ncbi:MAG: TIM barrel protein [Planctomycetota bacterium]|nr:TIM barrel protein [Planctomycetota bacterium]